MKLMIIESPGKREKLEQILGDDWTIAASYGHIRDLPINEIGVSAPNFAPQYVLTEKGAETVKRLKALANRADAVYLATDPDREGESISWHLERAMGLTRYTRVAWGEVTASKVKEAMLSPRQIDMPLVAAQEARRVLDRLFGYLVSPVLSDILGEIASAGRVQSPAVRLVVERERAIRLFKRVNHFGAKLTFVDGGSGKEWEADWMTKPDYVSDDEPYFMDRQFAEGVSEVKNVVVVSYTESTAKRSPPAPFITSTLQQAASVKLGFDPKQTMDIAQKLYDNGHITYHRSDNPNVSDDSLGDIYQVAVSLGLDMADEPRKFEAAEGAQVGHPGVTPTHWEIVEAGSTAEERALYQLIRLRAIASQLADAKYAVRTVQLSGDEPTTAKRLAFEGRGRTLVEGGWLRLLAGDDTDEDAAEDPAASNPIPALVQGAALTVAAGIVLEKATKAPKRFTQASLIAKLDSSGIGRPATYASIMDGILSREYVVTEKKSLRPTEKGERIVDALVGKFAFMDYGFTRELEKDLDRIAHGGAAYKAVVQRASEQLEAEIAHVRATCKPKHACPECAKAMRRIQGTKGPFWACSGYPECEVSMPDDGGAPGARKTLVLSEHACGKCRKPLVNQKQEARPGKAGFNFWACSGFAQGCKTKYPDKDGKPVVPEKG